MFGPQNNPHGLYETKMLALHQLHSREEPRPRKSMNDNTLNIDILVTRRTPEFKKNVPAGSVQCPHGG